MKQIIVGVLMLLLAGCGSKGYKAVNVANPEYKPNKVFEAFEDMASSKAAHLKSKYQIDTIFKGETGEFKRILLLRHWIKSVIPIEDYGDPYPGEGNVEAILDFAMKGQGYHCGHFMRVQNAVFSAYGYVTRSLGAGPGVSDARFEHHGMNEVWVNELNKWVLLDAKYDHHFEKNGIPLSGVEVRAEYMKNKGADIQVVKGIERKAIEYDEEVKMSKDEFAQTYSWITWDAYSNLFTDWPNHNVMLIMYDDEYNKNNIWIRGTSPHWIYNSPEYLRLVENIDEIYFTPNTISSNVILSGKTAKINLVSDTPNLKTYQMKVAPDGNWIDVQHEIPLELKKNEYALTFRTVNFAGITGPEHKIVIKKS